MAPVDLCFVHKLGLCIGHWHYCVSCSTSTDIVKEKECTAVFIGRMGSCRLGRMGSGSCRLSGCAKWWPCEDGSIH